MSEFDDKKNVSTAFVELVSHLKNVDFNKLPVEIREQLSLKMTGFRLVLFLNDEGVDEYQIEWGRAERFALFNIIFQGLSMIYKRGIVSIFIFRNLLTLRKFTWFVFDLFNGVCLVQNWIILICLSICKWYLCLSKDKLKDEAKRIQKPPSKMKKKRKWKTSKSEVITFEQKIVFLSDWKSTIGKKIN